MGYLFTFLNYVLGSMKFLTLVTFNLSIFNFFVHAFELYLRRLCLTQGHEDLVLWVFSESFVVLAFTSGSRVHLETMFVHA